MLYLRNNRKDTVPGVERARERVEADKIRVVMYSQITQGLVNLVMHSQTLPSWDSKKNMHWAFLYSKREM